MESGTRLLLYSLSEYRELVFQLFDVAGARSVVEVGAEAGEFTRDLAAWANAHGGKITCVEPHPTEQVRAWALDPAVRLVEGRSPAALAGLEPADAYLLDGDHNYATVRGELEAIDRACFAEGRDAVVLLHDVGWPCARRDLYYDPAELAPEGVHPHAFDSGVVPGDPGVVEGGFRGEGAFAVALREGGPRNGVLTAVEDFLTGRPQLGFFTSPLVFGLGVLFRRDAPWAARAEAVIRPYAQLPLLERVEENRIALYLRVLEEQDRRAADAAALEVERERRLEAEARLAELESSLSHRVADGVQSLKERLAPRGTLRRHVCDLALAAVKAGNPVPREHRGG
jgi:hypothetical protein